MNKHINWLERNPYTAWALVLLYAAVIFALSSMSNPPQPVRPSDGFGREVLTSAEHIIEYAILGILLLAGFRSLEKTRDHATTLAFLAAVLYGATDELHQYFIPHRFCDLKDLLADALGALLGVVIAKGWGEKSSIYQRHTIIDN